MSSRLGIADKLLIAALEIESSGKTSFSAEDLVVYAWQKFPEAFGLRGYFSENGKPRFPDSNRVYVEIMGSKPLRKNGFIRKVGIKLYRLTEAGRNRGKLLSDLADGTSSEKWALRREDQRDLKRLFEARAARKARQGNADNISFYDACSFWGITPRSNANDLISRFAHLEEVLRKVLEALGSREAASSEHGAIPFAADDLRNLEDLHEMLQQKFSSDLEFIKNRTDERK